MKSHFQIPVLGYFLAHDVWRKERTACFIGKKKSLGRIGKWQKIKLDADYFEQKDLVI